MSTLGLWLGAFALDLWLGDPPHWPHPVRWMGALIARVQRGIRACCHSAPALYAGGALLWLAVVGGSVAATVLLLHLLGLIADWLSLLAQLILIYSLLAGRSLADAALAVQHALRHGTLAQSRERLSWIVGRDTRALTPPQIARATVETVAENSVDGVIAPLLFLCLGGVPLMVAYKAVNTLDSMVGYRTERYRAIGCVSARMDDLANLLPARLSWLLLTLAAALLGMDWRNALRIGWRDRHCHKSPNSAWPEATVAGALGVRLGGPNRYFGEWVDKPWIGDARREVDAQDITRAVHLMLLASSLALLLFLILRLWLA